MHFFLEHPLRNDFSSISSKYETLLEVEKYQMDMATHILEQVIERIKDHPEQSNLVIELHRIISKTFPLHLSHNFAMPKSEQFSPEVYPNLHNLAKMSENVQANVELSNDFKQRFQQMGGEFMNAKLFMKYIGYLSEADKKYWTETQDRTRKNMESPQNSQSVVSSLKSWFHANF